MKRWLVACAVIGLTASTIGIGQDTRTADELQKYRDMLKDGNPAELMELRGESLWTTPRGPRNTTLERCDLGLGAGVVDGAYAHLPKFFTDTGKVQDAESRLVSCMVSLQGLTEADAVADWYKTGSDIEALVTFVATKSRGMPIATVAKHPKEIALRDVGEQIFFRRSGPLDFSCATCHSQDNRRIRLQELPNFLDRASARTSLISWPAYRVSQSAVWTLERRLIDCLRQMRYPDADFRADAVIALELYLHTQANGGVMEAPGIKR